MVEYANTVNYRTTNIIYVAKYGDDTYPGVTPMLPKLTIAAALAACAAGNLIEIVDAGTYTETLDFTGKTYSVLCGIKATIVPQITLADGILIDVNKIMASDGCYIKVAGSDDVVIDADTMTISGTGIGCCVNGGRCVLDVKNVTIADTGYLVTDTIGGSGAAGLATVNIGSVDFLGNGYVFDAREATTNISGHVVSVTKSTGSGTFINAAAGGTVDIIFEKVEASVGIAAASTSVVNCVGNSLDCTTAWTLADTSILNLHCNYINGTETNPAGTTVRVTSEEDGINNVVVGNQSATTGEFTNVTLSDAGGMRTTVTGTQTALLQAYDTGGASYTTFGTLTAGNPPTFDLGSSTTINSAYIYRVGGTDVAVADGGTGLGSYTDGQLLIGKTAGNTLEANTLNAGSNIVITNGAGTITISALTTTPIRTYTAVNTSPYVVSTSDDLLGVDCSGAPITIQLPNAPTTGSVWEVKDVTGSAAGNNITVTTVGGAVNIDGAVSYVMTVAYASAVFMYNGSAYMVL